MRKYHYWCFMVWVYWFSVSLSLLLCLAWHCPYVKWNIKYVLFQFNNGYRWLWWYLYIGPFAWWHVLYFCRAHNTSILLQVLLYNHKYKDKPTICTLLSICWSLWSTINCRVCCSFSSTHTCNRYYWNLLLDNNELMTIYSFRTPYWVCVWYNYIVVTRILQMSSYMAPSFVA